MGMIYRYADRPVAMPRELRYGVANVLWWWFDHNGPFHHEDDEEWAKDIRRFVRRRVPDADAISTVRNRLDDETVAGGCEAPEWLPGCDGCQWCQAMILRDWVDGLLDQAGSYRSPRVEAYCPVIDPAEPAKAWADDNCGCHDDVVLSPIEPGRWSIAPVEDTVRAMHRLLVTAGSKDV